MSRYRIGAVKSEFKLRVFSNDTIVKAYDIAIGERADGKARIYEEDFRTPEGSFKIARIVRKNVLTIPNRMYYPFYLAHKFGEPFTDLGSGVYGDGGIELTYPTQKDIDRYHELLKSGEIERDWHDFMEEKWRAVFEHIAETENIPFKDVKLSCEKRRSKHRCFLEGKTFKELYNLTPPQPKLLMAIHGTNDPLCIGHKISGGCIRMHNKDIAELIKNFAEIGTDVNIKH